MRTPVRSLLAVALLVLPLSALAQIAGSPVNYQTTLAGHPYVAVAGPVFPIWDMTGQDTRDNIVYGVATMVKRLAGEGQTVGAQVNGWSASGIAGQTWGIATEAVGMKGNRSILVGLEAMVANLEPIHDHAKIGINIVFNGGADEAGIGQGSNTNSTGLWFTSRTAVGFESAIKLDRRSISTSANRRPPAVLDLEDLDPATIGEVDLIRLPNGKAIRFNPVTNQLEVR
jgi:hypothetical protein